MTADSIRRMAMQVIENQQTLIRVNADRDNLVHLLGFNDGVLALAEELIGLLLDEEQTRK